MAPEIFEGKAYSHKVDVWALGVVFYQMMTGFTPFTGMDRKDLQRNLKKGDYELPNNFKLSKHGLDFLNSCLQHNPTLRPSWDDLMKHPYLHELDISEKMEVSFQGDVLTSSSGKIVLNTKNPEYFMQAQQKYNL